MNQMVNAKKLATELIASGTDDVTTTARLIGLGLHANEATNLISKIKKESDRNPLFLLNSSWFDWLQTNLNKGCDHSELVKIMFDNCGISDNDGFEIIKAMQNTEGRHRKEFEEQLKISNNFTYEDSFINTQSNIINIDGHEIRIAMKHDKPTVILFDNVLTSDECDDLIELSRLKLKQSKVVDNRTGESVLNKHRTSTSTEYKNGENDLIQKIEARIATLMNQPIENGEGFQVMNYQVAAEYRPHFDFFDPKQKGSVQHLERGGQRVATMVIYLNDVEAGGGTGFPEIGLTVNAKKGSAVYFEYCNSKGQLDKKTLHAGCPVDAGEKWILTKWVRQNKFG